MWRFFKDFFIYGVASVLGKIVAIFLMPVYTSILTKEEYGAMALITSVGGIIDLLSNLNIHSGIARDYYEDGIDRKKLVSTGFFSIVVISLFVLAILFISRRFWSTTVLGLNEGFLSVFTVFIFTTPFGSLQSYFSILTRYKKKPILYSIGTIIKLIIQVCVSIYGVVVLRAGIVSVFIGFLVSDLFGFLFFLYINKEYLTFSFDKVILRRAFIFSLPTIPAILAGWLDNSFGQILIGKYVSVSELGVYSIALSFASVFSLISVAFQNVWNPFLFENYKNNDFEFSIRKLFFVFAIFLIILCVVLSLFSKELVLLLSNEGYVSASKYLTLLCIPMSFYLLFPFASSGILISRDTKYIGFSYVMGSIANIIFLFLAIRIMGVIAVPISLSASRILSFFILNKVSETKINYRLPIYLLILLVAVVVICYLFIQYNTPLFLRGMIAILIVSGLVFTLNRKYRVRSTICQMIKRVH